ncbi:MAG: hypothetical protein ACRDPV_00480, partial [Gaiellaceae bacterium]
RTTQLPPPLPPERRTVGQLVAESIRLYGQNFLRALPLGIVVGVVNQLTVETSRAVVMLVLVVTAPVFAIAYAYAARLMSSDRAPLRSWLIAVCVGSLLFVPAALLFPWFALASVLWLALAGLAVPVAMVERTTFASSLRRGFILGRVDYVHAAGSLAALVILFFLMRSGLGVLLTSQADNTVRTAIFLADTVLGPLLFLGGAILYVDQEARLRSRGDAQREE